MFCPTCHTEYRVGFTKCADCRTGLVHDLPPKPPEPPADPTEYPSIIFLIWFVPLAYATAIFPELVLVRLHPVGFHPLTLWAGLLSAVVPAGGFWLIYQAFRHERKPWPYVVLAFVPFGFLWYRLVRYPHRPKLVRISPNDQPTA